MVDILSIIKEYKDNNKNLVCVEIIDSIGSTPRKNNAIMLVDENKKTYGTIGGGKLEFFAINDSAQVLKNQKTIEKVYNLNSDEDLLICGGTNKVKFTFLSKDNDDAQYIEHLNNILNDNSKCYVFGAGHVGKNVCKILEFIGMNVVCYDDRKEFADKQLFDDKIDVICAPYDDIENKVHIIENDYVIIMTNEHIKDYIVEKQVLKTNAYYIGCMGSEHKISMLNDKLLKEGFTKEQISRIHTPIGIQVSAESPEEIAVSVACEIILYKAKKENRKKIVDKKTILELYDNK